MVSLASKALAILIGIEAIAGKGPTGIAARKALDTAARVIIRSGPAAVGITRTAAPYAGRAALGIAAAPGVIPTVAGIAAYEAYQRGLLDPIGQAAQFSALQAQQSLMQPAGEFTTQAFGLDGRGPIVGPIVSTAKKIKRKASNFNKAIKKGMSTVRQSSSMGKKGTISNSKKAFATVVKTASAVKKTGKIAKAGIRRKIGLAIRTLL